MNRNNAVQTTGGLLAPLAIKDGVAPSRVWLPPGPWLEMGAFLIERFPHVSPTNLKQRINQGDIVTSTGKAIEFHSPYQGNQWLWYYRYVPNEVLVPFEMPILYADDQLIAVDKPHFLASTPGGQYLTQTALVRVRQYFNDANITPLHRLDRETAGVLLFCRQPQLRGVYQTLFQEQCIEKTYEAIAVSNTAVEFPLLYRSRLIAPKGQFLMQELPGEPNSETRISVRHTWHDSVLGELSYYVLQPSTGRKHQLRMHMLGLGTPILNDSYYPTGQAYLAPDDFSRPLQLLARAIAFKDPISQESRCFVSRQQLALAPVSIAEHSQ